MKEFSCDMKKGFAEQEKKKKTRVRVGKAMLKNRVWKNLPCTNRYNLKAWLDVLAKRIHICPALSETFPMMLQLMELLSRSIEALRSPLRSTGLSSAFGRPRSCLRNNYWTAEMQSNISSVSAPPPPPPALHYTPEAWLPNHLKYDMNEARGAAAYARIKNKTCKFHECVSLFSAIPQTWTHLVEF